MYDSDGAGGEREAFLLPGVIAGLLSAGILWYSQTTALDWDEGFHLVAAFLIKLGQRPYVDFCFPQPMLNADWNALWLRIFGESWRAIHGVAGVLTVAAMWLMTEFVFSRVKVPKWQAAATTAAALLIGMNAVVIEFGPKGQAYGTCLFLTVAAFRLTLAAAGKRGIMMPVAAGMFAGAAVCCTLLTAPACPVLLIWLWLRDGAGKRWSKAAGFLVGAAIPAIPVMLSFLKSPHLTWFNLVEYHTRYRAAQWDSAGRDDLQLLGSWVDSGQALPLAIFAVIGIVWVWKSDWRPERKWEFYLAAGMAAGLSAEAALAHPTFRQYFVFVVPFLAVLAALGLVTVASKFDGLRPWLVLGVLGGVLGLSLVNGINQFNEDNSTWAQIEQLAHKVKEVTPAQAQLLADPLVYFVLRRVPPPGAEFPASRRMEVPQATAVGLHVLPQSEMERQVKSGMYATVETCYSEEVEELHLAEFYGQKAQLGECWVYWGFRPGRR